MSLRRSLKHLQHNKQKKLCNNNYNTQFGIPKRHFERSREVSNLYLNPILFSIFYFLFSILLTLFSIPVTAQQYNWKWAVSGGGPLGGHTDEEIYDIKVGTDNNYYFIAAVYGKNGVQLDGQSVKTYNQSTSAAGGNPDIFLFSTTCDGTVRWSQAIGGGVEDLAYNLVLDSQNNVYIGTYVSNSYITPDGHPVHFSPTDSIPYPDLTNPQIAQEGFKTAYLVKYDSNGNYIKKEALEGTVNFMEFLPPQLLDLAIDSKDNLHFIIGLRKGNGYLDNNVNVPNTTAAFQYYLVKYDSDLDYVSSMLLPIPDGTGFAKGSTYFAYDENLNRYYLAGHRLGAPIIPLTYDGSSVVNRSFIFTIDGTDGGLLWHREIYTQPVNNQLSFNQITSLKIDTNSDIYMSGRVFQLDNTQPLKIYDPSDPLNTTFIHTPTVNYNIPILIKFNSGGTVQWAKTPTSYAPNYTSSMGGLRFKGIAIKNNEVAMGSTEGYFVWDSFTQNNGQFQGPSPTVLRFNKQTGTTIGMHWIPEKGEFLRMTALAVDRDGNYVTGGHFKGALFSNTSGITPITSAGESDFFVAKLGAYACGTNSTAKFNNIKVNVYPNPTNDIINIETDETLLNYVVYDMNGREIQNGMFGSSNQINLHGATAGTYFIKVTTTQGSTATVKVIKK